MSFINLQNIRLAEHIQEDLTPIRFLIESQLNLKHYSEGQKPVVLNQSKLHRICLLAGLAVNEVRHRKDFESIQIGSNRIFETLFTHHNLLEPILALLKLRYHGVKVDWDIDREASKVINCEIKRGADALLKEGVLEELLMTSGSDMLGDSGVIPVLDLNIGHYEDEIPAILDLNSKSIPNTQILVAGTTGSGKTNLLAVLLNEIRTLSIETAYPVNFLLFDYKGEFSDPSNRSWLSLFEVDSTSILDPVLGPLPFSPFKSFVGKSQNEVNLHSTEMANALCAIDAAKISANMSNRLSEAIIAAYASTSGLPITFERILSKYTELQPQKDRDKDDSVKSVLKQLIRSNIFATKDSVDLIKESFIVKMDAFPKDGPLAKAIVYFVVSKLNTLYEMLPKQLIDDTHVELRHFTIIDEAHYMLGFDNKPLRDLIAVGRNKGLSIILATQNMDSFKSDYFDFFANAQYPLIMKQQSINDGVIKDLFGVSGSEFYEVKQSIAGLQKGELIVKNPTALALGIGKKYKKVKIRHLI
jgi:energy-coupling factor transporter ATP-binding protein EcfA2